MMTDDVITDDVITDAEREEYARLALLRTTRIPFCPWTPNEAEDEHGNPIGPGPQHEFLADMSREAFYGGAVGGGKSIALMMAASQFLHRPGYAALLLRKSFADLEKPRALMDIASQWWGGREGVKFDRQNHEYTFECRDPYGQLIGHSTITFGSLDEENDRYKYQGGAYHFIGFDELTQHKERDYTYLFSRLRKPKETPIPTRMRSTGNPGGVGHEWVYKRFIGPWETWVKGIGPEPRRHFIPASLKDNTKLDQADYIESLMELDPITRAQLLRGDWNIRPEGRMFKREKFKPISRHDLPRCRWVRFWDMASTEPNMNLDPDYTVGLLMGMSADGRIYIADVRRWRHNPAENDFLCAATSQYDTRNVLQLMEQEPGASGKVAIHHYRNGAFRTANFRGVSAVGKGRGATTITSRTGRTPRAKIVAAGPVASRVDSDLCYVVVDGSWDVEAFLSEVEVFPDAEHDDQVDALSGAYNELARMPILAVRMGQENEMFVDEPYWKPDVTPHLSPVDVMTQQSLYGDRMEQERKAQEDLRRTVSNAWAM
jgi:predicted phage terminase large subunit-like protein